MLLAELHEAIRPKKTDSGQLVVRSLFAPPSVGVYIFGRPW